MDLPVSLLQELRSVKGFDEPAFIAAHQQTPLTSVRTNPAKDIGLFAENERVPWCCNGVYLTERPIFTLDPAYHAGAYYVQEASSMFLHHLLKGIIDGRSGLRVLDLCAAPGGKSTLIASLLDKESLLISNDVIRSRATILEENMTRWGHMNAWVTSNDPRDFGKLSGYFDVIVVDAPCSGSGLWRKDAKALDEWSEANVQLCSERQQRILADVWPALKEDGVLIYATCSYSPEEDEQILDWLAATYDVAPVNADVDEDWGIVRSSEKGLAGYRFFPDKLKGEGFFIAAVQKREEVKALQYPRFKSVHDKKIYSQAGYLLREIEFTFAQVSKDTCSAFLPIHEPDWHLLKQAVYLRNVGLNIGSPAGRDWIPAHEVALSIEAADSIPNVDVNKEQALRFLKREDIGIAELPKGWLMIKYKRLGLGWIKSLGNRANNYLPKNWRIRMDITEQ
ncbi:MAG: methyltransferase [Flavipsychrobacter sp.]|nr:methyltransferase [Flavipsychrobacter sp.]